MRTGEIKGDKWRWRFGQAWASRGVGFDPAKRDEGEGRHGEFSDGRLKKRDWDLIPIFLRNGK